MVSISTHCLCAYMERENYTDQNRKRRRDDDDQDDKKELLSSHKGKKPETMNISSSKDDYDSCFYEFYDNIGVFDFPWLKEGVIFKADEYLANEDMFASCSYLDQVQGNNFLANLDVQNSLAPPPLDQNFHDNYDKFDGGDSLWSFEVDDLEPLDCIWSSVLDQPLDNTCLKFELNKA